VPDARRALAAAITLWQLGTAAVAAQTPPARPNAPPVQQPGRQGPASGRQGGPGVSVGELQQLLEGLEVTRARTALELSDEQFARFLPRLEALQAVRRRAESERTRAVNELRRMTQAADAQFDPQIQDRLKRIADIDVRLGEERRRALEGIDEVLTLRQRALFRIFEEQMERQKADLLTRVRQANRL
jgi:hypothetical protein